MAASALSLPGGLLAASPAPVRRIVHDFKGTTVDTLGRSRVYLNEVGEAMPPEDFGFRPVPEVLSFAEHLGRIATSNRGWADLIAGTGPVTASLADVSTLGKQEILELVDGSFQAMIRAVDAADGSALDGTVPWQRRLGESPTTHPKWAVVVTMLSHVAHHRGALVVYLRLRGLEPPSFVD